MKKTFVERMKEVGPGAVVAAAFIGPGTVTSCFTSGASYGTTLLWAILFSPLSVIIMQSMASRLGIVTQMCLGEALRTKFTSSVSRILLAVLVISAVFIGNVAYETGNVSGSILGVQTISTALDNKTMNVVLALILGVVAFGLLWSGSYKNIEKFLTGLVVLMGLPLLGSWAAGQLSSSESACSPLVSPPPSPLLWQLLSLPPAFWAGAKT